MRQTMHARDVFSNFPLIFRLYHDPHRIKTALERRLEQHLFICSCFVPFFFFFLSTQRFRFYPT